MWGAAKPSVYKDWYDLDAAEFYRFIGLLMYMAIVNVQRIDRYWNTKSLYHGLWSCSYMTKKRFTHVTTIIPVGSSPAASCFGFRKETVIF